MNKKITKLKARNQLAKLRKQKKEIRGVLLRWKMKECGKCSEPKPYAEFQKNPNTKDGLSSYCRECHAKYNRSWRKNNPEKAREIDKTYRRNNKRKLKKRKQKYNEENKAKIKRYNQRYHRRKKAG